MDPLPAGSEPTVAEREAQRAAEQEALRNVRRLTDELEREQRDRRRMAKWGWVIAAIAVAGLLYVLVSIYVKARSVPPPAKIEVPGKVVVPPK